MIRPYVFPGKTVEGIKTARGRTGLFEAYKGMIYEHPIIGSGFAVGERSNEALGGAQCNWAHNSVIGVIVNTGMIGLFLFIGGFCAIGYNLYRADKLGNKYAYPLLISIMIGFLNSMSYPLVGSIWTASTTPFWGIVAYISIYLPSIHSQNIPVDLDSSCV